MMMQSNQLKLAPNLQDVLRLGVSAMAVPAVQAESSCIAPGEHVLIVDDGSLLVSALVEGLRAQGIRPLLLQDVERQRSAPTLLMAGQDPERLEHLIARSRDVVGGVAGIFFLSTTPIPFNDAWFRLASQRLRTAIAMVRGAHLQQETPLKFVYFVTAQGGRFGLQADAVDALAPGLEALAHPLRLEMPKTSFRSIDLDPKTQMKEQVQQLLQELTQPDQPYRTAYGWQDGTRTTLSVESVNFKGIETCGLDSSSVVVFAGGARGIGAVCAESLAAQVGCQLIFLGRTPLTDEIWELSRLSELELKQRADQFTQTYKAANPGCPPRAPRAAWKAKTQALEAIATLQKVEANGGKAEYFAVDVRDRGAVQALFQQLQQRFGKVDVVVHVAGLGGVDTDRMLLRKDWPTIDQVIETKVIGALHLLEASKSIHVPLFLGFGSIASRFGNTGQVDYAAANGLLNGIARAHNATGQHPVVRILSWGAWDGVGMAVSGPTKEMLVAYGLKFLAPDIGAACFLNELIPQLSESTPAELYISPKWEALTDLLKHQDSSTTVSSSPKLLGTVIEHQPQDYLKAEQILNPKQICFLDHHRYDGTSWMPAVMGMEVAVEAAIQLCPGLHPFALREIVLKKAIRLVRDESAVLLTEARIENVFGEITRVQVILSGQFKGRTWVFAEMQVLMSPHLAQPEQLLAQIQHPGLGSLQLDPNHPACLHRTRSQLYPSEWLRFHSHGSTFQLIDDLVQDCQARVAQGAMRSTTDLLGYETPLTWIDGSLQAYGELLCNVLGVWGGPPIRIGEIRWLPDVLKRSTARVKAALQVIPQTPSQVYLTDEQGQCLLCIAELEFGGTGVQSSTSSCSTDQPVLTPYLGVVLEHTLGERLHAEQILDAETEILLNDHRFPFLTGSFVFVPAVYFLEVAVEAAVRLNPGRPAIEVQNFQVPRAFHFMKEPQRLITKAEVVAPGKTHVQMFSRRGEKLTLHSEAWVIQGDYSALMPLPFPPLVQPEIRTNQELYPQRFPNGPVFQVIGQMQLGEGHFSESHLRLTGQPKAGCWLPITLLDGAFQVDSATRSGYTEFSGLPRSVASIRWVPSVMQTHQVRCFSSTGSDATDKPGDIFFMDDQQTTVLLQMTGIRLTPVPPHRGWR